MTEYVIHREDELRHYGVKGTKWGVRRYQNEDGSYKPGAEGRYYQPVKVGAGKKIGTGSGGKTLSSAGPKIQGKMNSALKGSSGGGGVADVKKPEEENKPDATAPYEKKLANGKTITVQPTSMKKAQTGKGSGSSGSSSSTKKEQEEKEKEKDFKLSQFTDKIDNLFGDMEDENWEDMDLDSSEIDQIDELITLYRKWREGNKSKTSKTKKIDAFIERYQAWRSNKKVEHGDMEETYLQHFGILGMKWGIRRYQNEDGSYTAEGKRRKAKGKNYSEDYWNAHDKKDPKYMSDKELQKRNNRLQQEQQYKALTKTKEDKAKEALLKGGKKLLAATIGATIMTMAVKYTRENLPDLIQAGGDFVADSVTMSANMKDILKKSPWLL